MKYKYGDPVLIQNGFYRGQVGRVFDYRTIKGDTIKIQYNLLIDAVGYNTGYMHVWIAEYNLIKK